jgi:hypothetical protein
VAWVVGTFGSARKVFNCFSRQLVRGLRAGHSVYKSRRRTPLFSPHATSWYPAPPHLIDLRFLLPPFLSAGRADTPLPQWRSSLSRSSGSRRLQTPPLPPLPSPSKSPLPNPIPLPRPCLAACRRRRDPAPPRRTSL